MKIERLKLVGKVLISLAMVGGAVAGSIISVGYNNNTQVQKLNNVSQVEKLKLTDTSKLGQSVNDNKSENLLSISSESGAKETKVDVKNNVIDDDNFIFFESTIIGLTDKGKKQTNLVIPDGITKIGDKAFEKITSFTSVFIPSSVETIGISAFENCINLKKIIFEIESKLTKIEDCAFKYCSALESIIIPSSVTSIGYYVFYGCSALQNVINESTVLFDWWVFSHDYNGKTLNKMPEVDLANFTNSVGKPFTVIGNSAFWKTSLTKIKFTNQIQKIDDYAFYECALDGDVIIPASVITIGKKAFYKERWDSYYQKNLKFIIPKSVTNIDDAAFEVCYSLEYQKCATGPYGSGACWSTGKSYFFPPFYIQNKTIKDKLLKVRSFLSDWGKKGVDDNLEDVIKTDNLLFNISNATITGLTPMGQAQLVINESDFPANVNSISNVAFQNATNLESITIPSNVTSIAVGAFSGCPTTTRYYVDSSSIEKLINAGIDKKQIFVISNNKYFITQNNVLIGLTDLGKKQTSLVILYGVTEIGGGAFSGCTLIDNVTIPSSVTSINANAFDGCTALKSVIFNDNGELETIGDYAFGGCTNLNNLITHNATKSGEIQGIPNSVAHIGVNAFSGCTNLNNITIPNSVTTIGDGTFSGCINLKKVIIPNSVVFIGYGVFEGCTNLKSVEIPSGVIYIGKYAFSGCTSLAKITFPNSVTSIGNSAFRNCTNLASVTFKDDGELKSIGSYAFSGCPTTTRYYVLNNKVKQLLSNCDSNIDINTYVKLVVTTPIFRTDWGSDDEIKDALPAENMKAKKSIKSVINDLIVNASDFNENNVANISLLPDGDSTTDVNVKIELKDGYVFEDNTNIYRGKISFSKLITTPNFRKNFKSTENFETWLNQKNSLSPADKNKEFLIGNTIDNDYISSIDLKADDKIKNQFNITIILNDGYLFENVRDTSGNRMHQAVLGSITYTQYWILNNPVIKPVLAQNALDYVVSENNKNLQVKYDDLIANKDILNINNIKDIELEANGKNINNFGVNVILKDNYFFQMKDSKKLIASWISTIALSMQLANPTLRTGFATTLDLKEWIPLVNNSGIVAQINMLFKDNVLTSGNTASINVEMADEAKDLFNITITLDDGYGFAGGEKTLTLNNIVFKQLNALDLPTMKNQDKSTITQHEATILDWWASLNSLEKQVNSVNDLLASPINAQAVDSINISIKFGVTNQFTFTIILKTGYVFQTTDGKTSDSWTSTPITYHQNDASIVANKEESKNNTTIGLAIGLPVGALVVGLLIWFIVLRVKTRKIA